MKYFIDKHNEIYAYELDGSQDEFIRDGLNRISEREALKIANPPISQQQQIKEAEEQKRALISEVTEIIALFQDSIDLEINSDLDVIKLKKWKEYRVLLSRVDVSLAPDINWPIRPVW
ncbi:tail fiber assembly protein [Providencia manganoxydans]|uniref:tail fiber assembly protein n=1 Tax=Providencia manganoxydans TaxID=2923283 RepID=UPI0032DBABF9